MIHLHFLELMCLEETNEVGADEPYLIVTVVDRSNVIPVAGIPVPIPAYDTTLVGPFKDVDKGNRRFPGTPPLLWGLFGRPAALDDPDQIIVVAKLMEHDDGNPRALAGIIKGVVGSSIFSTLAAERRTQVAALIREINRVSGTPTGAPNFDDQVGNAVEITFTADELRRADAGYRIEKLVELAGDGGRYRMRFGARNGISLRSSNFPSKYVRHRNWLGELTPVVAALDAKDATFRTVPGLAGSGMVSFESVNYPNFFLRHQNFELKLHERRLGDELLANDATFAIRAGLVDGTGVTLVSYNFPDRHIRHRNNRLHIDQSDGSPLFAADATFYFTDGLAPAS